LRNKCPGKGKINNTYEFYATEKYDANISHNTISYEEFGKIIKEII
jgi:hypothetical protein